MITKSSQSSLLFERAREAALHWRDCRLCEHLCGANRSIGEHGSCKAGTETRVFRHRVESGEEPELVPSHLFYVSGCDLRCAFCIAEANAFDPARGSLLTTDFLERAIAWGQLRGARNVQWVGGEPTVHLPTILRVMADCASLPPIVWKSDFYGSLDTWRMLRGVVTCYVADFKFGNDHCARRIASVDRYWQIVTRNLKTVAVDQDLIVRHLLMPGHFHCCLVPVTQWLARELPEAKFSLRDGYLPRWRARRYAELANPVSREEVQRAETWVRQLGLRMVN